MCGVAVVLVAAVLRWSLPASPQVIYDEFWYLATARHVAHAAHVTPDLRAPNGNIAEDEIRPPYPQGWPCLEAAGWWIGASDASWSYGVTLERCVGVAACLALFAMLAAESLFAATLAGLTLATLPAFLRLSEGASAEGASTLFIILALWAVRAQRFEPSRAGLLLAMAACAWAAHFRPENLFYVALFVPLALTSWTSRRELALALALLAALILPDVAIMASGASSARAVDHFVAQPRPGFHDWQENMRANLASNVAFFYDGQILPRWISALAVIEVALLARRRAWRPILFYGTWIVGLTLILSPYPFGDFESAHSLDTWRFSVAVTLPLILLAAGAVEMTCANLKRAAWPVFVVGVVVACGASTIPYWDFDTAPNAGGRLWPDLVAVAAQVPPHATVVTNDDSTAIALQEAFGIRARLGSADATASEPTGCWLDVGVDASPMDQRRRVLWTTGPLPNGQQGMTLYR